MSWKAIGKSVIGTSHVAAGKGCEDALQFESLIDDRLDNVLLCCVSDGAGSAKYGGEAAAYCTKKAMEIMQGYASSGLGFGKWSVYGLVEQLFDGLEELSWVYEVEMNELSCTFLGCYIEPKGAVFFQIGDGAIIRMDETGFYSPVFWPDNGEYQNSTSFIVDDRNFPDLRVAEIEDRIKEVAMFTDGLQLLALNTENQEVHQPFFTSLFPHLRLADDEQKVNILNRKLEEYLNSKAINDRTDDDKTLFLATRLSPPIPVVPIPEPEQPEEYY